MNITRPTIESIPKNFFSHNDKWRQAASKIFFSGIYGSQIKMKPEFEPSKGWFLRQIEELISDVYIDHNDKMAGTAFVLFQYCDDIFIELPVEDPISIGLEQQKSKVKSKGKQKRKSRSIQPK